jgi:hypothetical protein
LWAFGAGSSGGAVLSAFEGTKNAKFVSQSGFNSPVTKLVSPPINLITLNSPLLVFRAAQESWNGNQNELKVYYRTGNSDPWIQLIHLHNDIDDWAEVIIPLPDKSATYQIAFEGINNWGRANVVDQVMIEDVTASSDIDWYNLQWPGSASIQINHDETIYAQCWEDGVTNLPGPGTGIECWIGYSSTNTNPNSWSLWVPAVYNLDVGNNDEYMASLGSAQGLVPGTYYYASRFRYNGGSFVYGGFSGGAWNGTTNGSGVLTVTHPVDKSLNLTLFVEGIFNGTSMNKVQNESEDQFSGLIADQVTVELHNSLSPFTLAAGPYTVDLNTDGTASVSIPSALVADYFIVIRHRNSIETWSSNPVSFSGTSVNYNFSSSASQAYGNNLKLISGKYVLYSGDVNQDGIVDASDMVAVDNDAANFSKGYLSTDINGDGLIDASDVSILQANGNIFISKLIPE